MLFKILISIVIGALIAYLQIVEVKEMCYTNNIDILDVIGLITFFSVLVFTLTCGICSAIN